jgi:hypothetical protein
VVLGTVVALIIVAVGLAMLDRSGRDYGTSRPQPHCEAE